EPAPRRGREREREREDESEDESDILEESPCGRWQKRREQVNQGNMPGIQSTFLAMDTEEGVEVVWNELHFGDRKAFAAHEVRLAAPSRPVQSCDHPVTAFPLQEKIQTMFEQLALVDHPNIVKLHKYWLDSSEARARVSQGWVGVREALSLVGSQGSPPAAAKPASPPVLQVIFITEYVSSGSLKQFLKKTKKNHKAMSTRVWGEAGAKMGSGWGSGQYGGGAQGGLGPGVAQPLPRPSNGNRVSVCPLRCQAWKRWCTQILSALRYSEVSFLELDKFLEDVRNGIYPLMNFAVARPLGLPRVLAPPPEEAQKAKTPTPEPFDSETRKASLTLLLVLEDRLHRQLTYDLLPTDSAQDLAAELVHYGFLHEDDRTKLAAFLETTFLKYQRTQS
ncbi:Nuclear receptor-binding protein 2, partial [Heterocephalus glaber]